LIRIFINIILIEVGSQWNFDQNSNEICWEIWQAKSQVQGYLKCFLRTGWKDLLYQLRRLPVKGWQSVSGICGQALDELTNGEKSHMCKIFYDSVSTANC
jgi:hypothetical protein